MQGNLKMGLDYHKIRVDLSSAERTASYVAPVLRGRCNLGAHPVVRFLACPDISEGYFLEHASFTSAAYVTLQEMCELHSALGGISQNTALVAVERLGIFSCADTVERASINIERFVSGQRIEGETLMKHGGRMAGRVFVVTGGAQGLGRSVAQILLKEGAYVVVADLNGDLAQKEAAAFCETFGKDRAIAVQMDVSCAESVEHACIQAVLSYGGIDVMFSNAGIVIPGELEQLTTEDMTNVFAVNCIGYFHCTKYAARYMKIQRSVSTFFTADIICTSSVAGMIGYPRNSPYCATKFAVLGMTESFAKELLPYQIKVNAVCPGNYLDGPLWSDPDKGLFLQYLRAGKVPNGETIQDSVRYYRNREPMKRGLQAEDMANAVMYCVEQQFETGIALPVTGGLAMGAIG